MTEGKNIYDLLYLIFEKFPIWCVLLFFFLTFIFLSLYVISKNLKAFNEFIIKIDEFSAKILPRKRKKVFEKKLNFVIDNVKRQYNKEAPPLIKRFLPYDLHIKWVDKTEEFSSIIDDKQVIVYVPHYSDEKKLSVSVIYNYCSLGFAEKAKHYMTNHDKKATDLVITRKLLQSTNPYILDYFNREYIELTISRDQRLQIAYDKLVRIDNDGLFLPVLVNEIDKLATKIYPLDPCQETTTLICNMIDFIFNIVNKQKGEKVDTLFSNDFTRFRVILAVSDDYMISRPLEITKNDIEKHLVDTIYILATGSKISYALEIAEITFRNNEDKVFEPIITKYKRRTMRAIRGIDSVCCELNIISID